MQMTSEALERAIEELTRLPGTGRKSAQRMAVFLLKQKDEKVFALADALVQLKKSVVRCSSCGTITEQDPCPICVNPKRQNGVICVVEEFQDVYLIEKTNEFSGVYHVLGGSISPLENVGPDDLRIRELLDRVRISREKAEGVEEVEGIKKGKGVIEVDAGETVVGETEMKEASHSVPDRTPITEVVLALNPDAEGEATAYYINKLLQPYGVNVTRIAYGIPMGTELEYIDEATLGRAFASRTAF